MSTRSWLGDLSQRCERSDADETGRDLREIRETQDGGDPALDQQGR